MSHEVIFPKELRTEEFRSFGQREATQKMELSQGINESANNASCRDCPSYLASAETVRDLLLPAETIVLRK